MKRRRKNQLNDIEEKAFKKIGLNSKKSSPHFKKIKPTGNDPDHWDPTSYMTVGAASVSTVGLSEGDASCVLSPWTMGSGRFLKTQQTFR